MRHFSFVLLFVLCLSFVATGCWHSTSPDCVEGNGVVETQDRTPGAFTGIRTRGSVEVTLQEGPPSVSIQTDSNILPYVITSVDGDLLTIDFKENVCVKARVKAIVHVPSVHMLSIEGAGNITGTAPFSPNTLALSITGSGNITFAGTTTSTVSASITGSGDIYLRGNTTSLSALVAGSGDIHAFDLPAEKATASIRGSGNVEVHVTRHLNATITGSGSIFYMGNPIVSTSITGSGKVYPR